MLERALQPTADKPRVERVVAVLDQHRAVCETQERATSVLEFGRSDEHRRITVVGLPCRRADWSSAVDARVEEGKGAFVGKPLGAPIEGQEGRVAAAAH